MGNNRAAYFLLLDLLRSRFCGIGCIFNNQRCQVEFTRWKYLVAMLS